MNCVLSPTLDHSSSRTVAISKSALTIQLFLHTNGLSDVWHFQNPTSKSFSFFSPVHGTYSHIDYFFRLGPLPIVSKFEYQAIVISDHAPVLMTLCIPTSHTNNHPWGLNTLLLSDEGFVNFISAEITSFFEYNHTPEMSPSIVWESMKAYLRGQIISYCALRLRKRNNARLEQLTNDILKLDATFALAPSNDLVKHRLVLQTECNLLSTRHTENLINKIQSGAYEFGEKTGKILAHQLHQKTADRIIAEINDELGTKHIDHSEINMRFYKFYEKLYTAESVGDDNLFDSFFGKLNTPTIDNDIATGLEEPFSTEELTNAVNSMQNGKANFIRNLPTNLPLFCFLYLTNRLPLAPFLRPCDKQLYHLFLRKIKILWNAAPFCLFHSKIWTVRFFLRC